MHHITRVALDHAWGRATLDGHHPRPEDHSHG